MKRMEKKQDITTNAPIILSKDALGISGNLNAKKIKNICDKHRIRYRLATPGESLERVKRERNSLAVILFLIGILDGMKNYYDQKLYKLPTA